MANCPHDIETREVHLPEEILDRIEKHVDFMRYRDPVNLICNVLLEWIEKKDESLRDHMAYREKVDNLEPGARLKKR